MVTIPDPPIDDQVELMRCDLDIGSPSGERETVGQSDLQSGSSDTLSSGLAGSPESASCIRQDSVVDPLLESGVPQSSAMAGRSPQIQWSQTGFNSSELKPAPTKSMKRFARVFKRNNQIIASVAGVLSLLLAGVAFFVATNENSSDLKPASLVIDRPQNIEQAIRGSNNQVGASILGNDEVTYVVDVSLQNEGSQAALITGITVRFTDAFEPKFCGTVSAGGSGLTVSGLYDIEYSDFGASQLPIEISKSTRLEVPAREFARFALRIGPSSKAVSAEVKILAFDVYVQEAGSDVRALMGQGKMVSSVKDVDSFIQEAPQSTIGPNECMKENAEQISRIVSLPGATSPKLVELEKFMQSYRY